MLTVLLATIAAISLVVGGIGIMNIMYVSVTEQTKEIGLRMSIGAKGRDILFQFLVEAILISIPGGIIGVGLGMFSSWLIHQLLKWATLVAPSSVWLSFLVCAVTGIFFKVIIRHKKRHASIRLKPCDMNNAGFSYFSVLMQPFPSSISCGNALWVEIVEEEMASANRRTKTAKHLCKYSFQPRIELVAGAPVDDYQPLHFVPRF